MFKSITLFSFSVFVSTSLSGQILNALKDKAQSLATKENMQKVASGLKGDLDKARASFDSTDFDYAILVSDNSALFDVKEKGEFVAKLATGASMSLSLVDTSQTGVEEKARFQLEMGEVAYASRKYSFAEKRFNSAITLYEQANLDSDIGYMKALAKSDLKDQKIDLDSMERSANAMERKLSESSKDFSSGYSAKKISYAQVRDLLTETEALVEIIRVRKYDQKFTADANYVALILKKGSELPKLVVLENGQQLETRYAKFYRNAIQQRIVDDYSYDQYWTRIEPDLQGKKMIYLSPDGVYNQINLNTLKKPDADFIINRYDLVIIGNSKDLFALKNRKKIVQKKEATLLGFPDYGTKDIVALPATKIEIDGVARIIKPAGYVVKQYMQKTATESNLKLVKAPVILHIATHGYFLQDVYQEGTAFGVQMENANDNPLLRSGILLAGAGNTVTGKASPSLTSNDNGILTAYEAMNLNLNGTSLIILSACETGLGDVKAGEGVYGLQRSFLVAGAEALIMSLWKVDDAATQQLMTYFYTNWVKLGNKQKAFKQAQLQLMTKYKDPYYWGAFVMMGQ